MSHAKRLNNASGILFLCGFICSKLHFTPVVFFSAILNVVSLAFYLMGYLFWLIACQLHPNHPRKNESWYGFSQFKEQYITAAAIGAIATVCCFIAVAFPIVIIPASWLFAVSNLIWSIAEFHKLQHPPQYEQEYSSKQQRVQYRYSLIVAVGSILTALASTIAIIFPPIAVATFLTTTVLGTLLSLMATHQWVKANLEKHEPDNTQDSSSIILHQLNTNKKQPPEQEETFDLNPMSRPDSILENDECNSHLNELLLDTPDSNFIKPPILSMSFITQ